MRCEGEDRDERGEGGRRRFRRGGPLQRLAYGGRRPAREPGRDDRQGTGGSAPPEERDLALCDRFALCARLTPRPGHLRGDVHADPECAFRVEGVFELELGAPARVPFYLANAGGVKRSLTGSSERFN